MQPVRTRRSAALVVVVHGTVIDAPDRVTP